MVSFSCPSTWTRNEIQCSLPHDGGILHERVTTNTNIFPFNFSIDTFTWQWPKWFQRTPSMSQGIEWKKPSFGETQWQIDTRVGCCFNLWPKIGFLFVSPQFKGPGMSEWIFLNKSRVSRRTTSLCIFSTTFMSVDVFVVFERTTILMFVVDRLVILNKKASYEFCSFRSFSI